ncbi:MAG: DNA primase [Rhizobiales bacterium]|nr:DNA primase [Hyphomicrobiales bacterium]MBO6697477.1 DNA primase [Hyphomicrobiales bacterium]MBO6736268.1 DNA primase [Hyphomicrobiales bacterium]MBO6912738.1 DNA primase [Hyphomicrobiales bacterium]
MIRFTDGFLSTIRDRIPLSDIVGRRVSWDRKKSRPAKGDHWACCPFHGEKTPSFHVDDRKGRYHCFGCSESGDHFRFLMEMDGLSFPEAVERLAGEAGMAMPAPDPEAARRQKVQLKLHDVLELAASYFERHLHAPEGQHALAYALKRGLDADIQKTFRIGFAPDRRDGMISFLTSHDVPVGDMIDAGLVIAPEDGGRAPYDRFRGRLMVAIEDQRGKVVGFGGRVLGDGEPKYLNSPETDLFRKREMVFNAKRARQAAHQNGRLIVVEGYMDAIALHRAGFQEVVASLGTAMGEEQIALMWRFTDEPVVCFDGDGAGERAAHRAIDRALPMLKPGKSLKFLFLPKGMDPDDFVSARGADAFEAELSNALPMIEALWARETAGLDVSTPERMAAFQTGLSRLVAGIEDATVRQHYDQALKDRFYAMRRALRQAQNPQGSRPAGPGRMAGSSEPMGAKARTAPKLVTPEMQLLALAQRYPDEAMRFADRDVFSLCQDEALARRLETALQGEGTVGDQTSLEALPFPILKQEASPRFIGMLFAFLFARMELRCIEAEAASTLSLEPESMSEAAMERLVAIQNEARSMQAQIDELERQLDEEASMMRSLNVKTAS